MISIATITMVVITTIVTVGDMVMATTMVIIIAMMITIVMALIASCVLRLLSQLGYWQMSSGVRGSNTLAMSPRAKYSITCVFDGSWAVLSVNVACDRSMKRS